MQRVVITLTRTQTSTPRQFVQSTDGSEPTARHESGAVVSEGKIYLLGGRGNLPVEQFDTDSKIWRNLGSLPIELHHFQPVVVQQNLYIVGAFTCCYPDEPSVAAIYRFNTLTETWDTAGTMPADRLRGSAAAVAYKNKIYLVGGNTQGHDNGAVAWLDEYNPATGEWITLPDAPHARDHFQAVIIGDKLVATAGRQSRLPNPNANPVLATDIYDFNSARWSTGAPIPTPRAGAVAVAHGVEVIALGGEINTAATALDTVEAYNIENDTWRAWQPLLQGRHSGGGAVVDNQIHMVAGSITDGGAEETASHEVLQLLVLGSEPVEPMDPGSSTGSNTGTVTGSGGRHSGFGVFTWLSLLLYLLHHFRCRYRQPLP